MKLSKNVHTFGHHCRFKGILSYRGGDRRGGKITFWLITSKQWQLSKSLNTKVARYAKTLIHLI